MLVVGTAGHIDHGKTTFIKALTNIDTDRLAEEKKRGITIALGYASIEEEGSQISFIDVPGHEKFVKTMMAGASGIDAVMLIIAADEGIKPQTEEHFRIIEHLGIHDGVIVLTKCDLVDDTMLTLRHQEIKRYFKGTFLEQAPCFHFSIKNRDEIKAIKTYLLSLSRVPSDVKKKLPSRLYIDRIFTLKGKGTIITGTLLEGAINLNEQLYLYPSGEPLRVKGIQVHGKVVSEVSYGNRVALNVTIDTSMGKVGDLVTSHEHLEGKYMVDVSLKADTQIKHWERIRFFTGTKEVFGRIAIPNQGVIASKASLKVQLRLEAPIFANVGDRFILRRFSPVETLGGGVIVDLNTKKKTHDVRLEDHNELSVSDQALMTAISRLTLPFGPEHQDFKTLSYSQQELSRKFLALLSQHILIRITDNLFLSHSQFEKEKAILYDILNQYHMTHPYQRGLNRATLKSKQFKKWSKPAFDGLLDNLESDQYIQQSGIYVATGEFEVIKDDFYHRVSAEIMALMREKAFTVTRYGELKKIIDKSQKHYDIFTYLNYLKIIVKIDEDNFITGEAYGVATTSLLKWFEHNTKLSVAEFRDFLNISRKTSVTLLEHFDAIALTKRIDNNRELIKIGLE